MGENRELRMDDINILSVVIDVLRNFWVIVLAVASVWMGISAYAKFSYVPEYKSVATLSVSAKGGYSAFSSLNMTSEMAGVFAEVFQSNILRDKVAEEMGMETLKGRITTEVIPQTNLLRISVISENPEEAFRTLDLILDNYHLVSDYLFDNAVLEVVKEPNIPTWPYNKMPDVQRKKFYALAVGFLTFAAIVAFSILRDTIKTPQAAKQKLDGEMLGVIPHEIKNKTKRLKKLKKKSAVLMTNPLTSFAFKESYQSLAAKLDYRMRKNNQKILMVTSASENEGKSTVAANIALALSERKRNVLIVDCDFKKPAMQKIFELQKGKTKSFSDYISGAGPKYKQFSFRQSNGILIAANHQGTKHSQRLIVSDKLRRFLDQQKQKMDYIILDSPPFFVASDAEALAQLADVSLLVVRQDFTLAGDVNDCIDSLQQTSSNFVGYVLNNYRDISFGNKMMSTSSSHRHSHHVEK